MNHQNVLRIKEIVQYPGQSALLPLLLEYLTTSVYLQQRTTTIGKLAVFFLFLSTWTTILVDC